MPGSLLARYDVHQRGGRCPCGRWLTQDDRKRWEQCCRLCRLMQAQLDKRAARATPKGSPK